MRTGRVGCVAVAMLCVGASSTMGQGTSRVSVTAAGAQLTGYSQRSSVSADGRYVAFSSSAADVVVPDNNPHVDVFVRDRVTGATTLVSRSSSGTQTHGDCDNPRISADGRYVVFDSYGDNLVPGDTDGGSDAFRHDRLTGTTVRVALQITGTAPNAMSGGPAISGDGRYVAFQSAANNLVPNDINSVVDIFVRDMVGGGTVRASRAYTGQLTNYAVAPSISDDGRYVTYVTVSANVVPNDSNNREDVFLFDRVAETTERVSVSTAGTEGNGTSSYARISGDGRYVFFRSDATNLVAGDTNNLADIFVHDRIAHTTERATARYNGQQLDGLFGANETYAVSRDGRYLAFSTSNGDVLAVPHQYGATADIFLRDRYTGTVDIISIRDSDGWSGNGDSRDPALTADGRTVFFTSFSNNLVTDTNNGDDVFVRGPFGPPRALMPIADFDGDHLADTSVFRPVEGAWYILRTALGSLGLSWGTCGDIPVPADYDGDGRADFALFRPSDGGWYIVKSSGGSLGIKWGTVGDIPVPADYDGDGIVDVGVFRPADNGWYILRSTLGPLGLRWGVAGDVPVPADYDGDHRADIGVFRPSDSGWYIVRSTGGSLGLRWGTTGDVPVVADYDGDGRADIGVFRARESGWYFVLTTGASRGFRWGTLGDLPVFGDFDGDGVADVAVFRQSDGGWYILRSAGGSLGRAWGTLGDWPM